MKFHSGHSAKNAVKDDLFVMWFDIQLNDGHVIY